ncbi:Aldehyde/histidinol dehydrogenase [Mycena leptocephala]|nr:Aldehyde/histidinol dehydrogenase [Mycena leptocephala]
MRMRTVHTALLVSIYYCEITQEITAHVLRHLHPVPRSLSKQCLVTVCDQRVHQNPHRIRRFWANLGKFALLSTSMAAQISISPHDLQPYCQRIQSTSEEVDAAITRAAEAQQWAAVPLAERIAIGHKFIEDFTKLSERIPQELTKMMGRPVSHGAGEVYGVLERSKYINSRAASCLADVPLQNTDKPGFRRFIKRVLLDVVLVIAPWKSVRIRWRIRWGLNILQLSIPNSVLPALLAGNAVILKPSPQTPMSGERLSLALHRAGVPKDAIILLHLSHEITMQAVQSALTNFVSLTGSVVGRRESNRPRSTGPDSKEWRRRLVAKTVHSVYVHESLCNDDYAGKFVEIVKVVPRERLGISRLRWVQNLSKCSEGPIIFRLLQRT